MGILRLVLGWLLDLLFWAFIGRFILDLVISINRSYRPRGLLLVISELVFSVTDPALKFLRRFIKPIRVGSVQFDLAWTVAVLLIGFLQSLVAAYVY